MRLRPLTPEENREQLIEFYNNPPPEWVEYYKNKKQILLVDTSGLNYTMGIRLPTKDYKPTNVESQMKGKNVHKSSKKVHNNERSRGEN